MKQNFNCLTLSLTTVSSTVAKLSSGGLNEQDMKIVKHTAVCTCCTCTVFNSYMHHKLYCFKCAQLLPLIRSPTHKCIHVS